jgi:dihydroorotate dehydrogenase electron transfer subunit
LRLNPPPGFVQALLTPPMPCGVGACRACWVEVGTSRRLACVHGPVFEM